MPFKAITFKNTAIHRLIFRNLPELSAAVKARDVAQNLCQVTLTEGYIFLIMR